MKSEKTEIKTENFEVDEQTLKAVVWFGYPESYVKRCLKENDINYCTMAYYLLMQDQNYEIE